MLKPHQYIKQFITMGSITVNNDSLTEYEGDLCILCCLQIYTENGTCKRTQKKKKTAASVDQWVSVMWSVEGCVQSKLKVIGSP